MEKYYLRIEDSNSFTFVIEGTHKILDTDIPIKIEDYEIWKNTNGIGKLYRLKEVPTGNELFDYIEGYTPEKEPIEPGAEEFMLDLEYRVSLLELGV